MNKRRKKCNTPYCRNRISYGNFCGTCRSRKSRQKNLYRYAFITLKNNAKRRNVSFTITFEYFLQFARSVKYIQNKSQTRYGYTIDRINNNRGYVPGNLQILTREENSRKGIRKLAYDYYTRTAVYY